MVTRLAFPWLENHGILGVSGYVFRVRVELGRSDQDAEGRILQVRKEGITRMTLSRGRLRYERSLTGPSLPIRVASRNSLYEMKNP